MIDPRGISDTVYAKNAWENRDMARKIIIRKVDKDTELAELLLSYVENCSWTGVREHIAGMIRAWAFSDWETMFAALADGKIVGMASVMKTVLSAAGDLSLGILRFCLRGLPGAEGQRRAD